MAYSAEELAELNNDFVAAVNALLPTDFEAMTQWLQAALEVSTIRNVRAWFGMESFSRNFISANTSRVQKPARIQFARSFLGRLQSNRPERSKDFFLNPNGAKKGISKFKKYFEDDFILQNLTYLQIDGEKITLSYATESDPQTFTHGEFDLSHPVFDEFRSGTEIE